MKLEAFKKYCVEDLKADFKALEASRLKGQPRWGRFFLLWLVALIAGFAAASQFNALYPKKGPWILLAALPMFGGALFFLIKALTGSLRINRYRLEFLKGIGIKAAQRLFPGAELEFPKEPLPFSETGILGRFELFRFADEGYRLELGGRQAYALPGTCSTLAGQSNFPPLSVMLALRLKKNFKGSLAARTKLGLGGKLDEALSTISGMIEGHLVSRYWPDFELIQCGDKELDPAFHLLQGGSGSQAKPPKALLRALLEFSKKHKKPLLFGVREKWAFIIAKGQTFLWPREADFSKALDPAGAAELMLEQAEMLGEMASLCVLAEKD